MLCAPLFVWKDRTIVSRCASRASCDIVSPNHTPGRLVSIAPRTVRIPSGASGFGSNVSNWLGPPCWNRKMTDLPVVKGCSVPAARPASSDGNASPPNPNVPRVRNSRRLTPRPCDSASIRTPREGSGVTIVDIAARWINGKSCVRRACAVSEGVPE